MIFATPKLQDADWRVLETIASQRERLRTFTQTHPKVWSGSLRRNTLARAIQGSNSIEGIHAKLGDVIAVVENEEPEELAEKTRLEIEGYQKALTYIMQAASDSYFEFSKQFLKSLQFMMLSHDMTKNPGQWRPGNIFIVNQATGETVYEGPDPGMVNGLIEELVAYLRSPPANEPVIAKAAMAHLNLTMIHPFTDGNGRVSRALQTLVFARDGILHPAFSSIEEWLGRNTEAYYKVLAEVGQGKWNPQNDALPWVRFCFRAQFNQAAVLLRRNEEYGALFGEIEKVAKREKIPIRSELTLFDAAFGMSITNKWHRITNAGDISEVSASRDLKRLCDVGLLVPKGERRGRTYHASKELLKLRESVRIKAPYVDPYDLVLLPDFKADEPRLPL